MSLPILDTYILSVESYTICHFVYDTSLSIVSSKFINIVACDRISFKDWILFHCVYIHISFICSSVDGYLHCFHFLSIVNNAAVDISVQISAFSSFGNIYRSGIARSYSSSIFIYFLRNRWSLFHIGCTVLYSYEQCRRIPISPHPYQRFFSF